MALQVSDLQVYKSSGNFGGSITGVTASGFNVFGSFTGAQTALGEVRYACIYLQNNSTTNTAKTLKLLISEVTSHGNLSYAVGLGLASKGSPEALLATMNTEPAGVTFNQIVGTTGELDVGDLTVGQYKSIWLRIIVPAGSSPKNDFGVTLSAIASTGE